MLLFPWHLLIIPSWELLPQIKSFLEGIMSIDLNKLLVQSEQRKAKKVVYDKDFGVSFDLMYLSKPEFQALIGKHTKIDFNKKNHKPEETINADALNEEIAETCIKGWEGVTYEWLSKNVEIDLSKVEDKKAKVEYSRNNVLFLMKNVYSFDNWLIETIRDASNFSEKKEEERKN